MVELTLTYYEHKLIKVLDSSTTLATIHIAFILLLVRKLGTQLFIVIFDTVLKNMTIDLSTSISQTIRRKNSYRSPFIKLPKSCSLSYLMVGSNYLVLPIRFSISSFVFVSIQDFQKMRLNSYISKVSSRPSNDILSERPFLGTVLEYGKDPTLHH